MKFSQEQIKDTKLPLNLLQQITEMELSMYMKELSSVDKGMLGYYPIEDNNSNFDLVEIKTTNSCDPTPHCKIHGSMNAVGLFEGGKLWRCLQSNRLKDCRAGCVEKLK